MPASDKAARLEGRSDDSREVHWSTSGLGPEISDPRVLQRIERALLDGGRKQTYHSEQEIPWIEGICAMHERCRRDFEIRFADGQPFSGYQALKEYIAKERSALERRRRATEASVSKAYGSSNPGGFVTLDQANSARKIAFDEHPRSSELQAKISQVSSAEKAFKAAISKAIGSGQLLTFRFEGNAWTLLSPDRAAAVVRSIKRKTDAEKFCFLASGDLPVALQKPAEGGPRGSREHRVRAAFREAVKEASPGIPWMTKAEAHDALLQSFPDLSKNMFEKIWRAEAPKEMKNPAEEEVIQTVKPPSRFSRLSPCFAKSIEPSLFQIERTRIGVSRSGGRRNRQGRQGRITADSRLR